MNVLRPREVCEKLKICRTLLHELRKEPDFPRPIVLGRRARGFDEAELDAWLASKKKGGV